MDSHPLSSEEKLGKEQGGGGCTQTRLEMSYLKLVHSIVIVFEYF